MISVKINDSESIFSCTLHKKRIISENKILLYFKWMETCKHAPKTLFCELFVTKYTEVK